MNIKEHIEKLKALGVTSFEITYSGSGDEGSVDEVTCEPAEALKAETGENVPHTVWSTDGTFKNTVRPETAGDLLEEFAYEYLEECHPGWEINDGQSGTISYDGEKVTHMGESYFTSSREIMEEIDV